MFYYILLMIWILVIPLIIILSKRELKSNIRLFIVQLYNFIIGLSIPIIYLITIWSVLIIFNDSYLFSIIDNLLYIVSTIVLGMIFALLFIPINTYMKRKINMNTICYIFLSIIIIGLGIISCTVLAN